MADEAAARWSEILRDAPEQPRLREEFEAWQASAPENAAAWRRIQAAVSAAMSRVQEILGSDEAKGRASQANVFAFKTDLPAAQVKELLAAAPVVSAAPQTNSFAAAMAATPNPEVGAGASGDEGDGVMANILANFK